MEGCIKIYITSKNKQKFMSEQNSQNLNEEDYLRKHLQDIENRSNGNSTPKLNIQVEQSRVSDLQYFAFDVKEFPCGIFYPPGTTIQVRPAQVKEIQAYSMVDDNNFYDIIEKMNDMLSSCVRIKYIDGKVGSYIEIKDPDRFYLIFLIRELTFQQGTSLTTTTTCTCGEQISIELKRDNFKRFEIPEKISKFYDPQTLSFRFSVKNGKTFNLAPPTIGLQKSFTEYIVKENNEKRKPNLSFLKVIPFLLTDRTTITLDGIKAKLSEYEKIDDISFQFLNGAVEKMSFGIEKLRKNCSICGLEVTTDMTFPDGPSAIFVVHDAFDQFIEE
jgi:hypothetical protein